MKEPAFLKYVSVFLVVTPMTFIMAAATLILNEGYKTHRWLPNALMSWLQLLPIAYISALMIIPLASKVTLYIFRNRE